MPHVFGVEHLTYLFVVIVVMTIGFILIHKHVKTDKQIKITIKIIGFILLLAIVWNRLSISILRDGFEKILPGTYCGLTSLLLALSAIFLKKNNPVFHCIAYVGLLGGTVTLIYPDFIDQANSIFYPMTISGLLHHTIMVFLVIVMLMKGYLKPELKKWFILPLGLAMYMIYALGLIHILGYDDAMYINKPILNGTIMKWYILGLILLPYHFIFLLIWKIVQKKKM